MDSDSSDIKMAEGSSDLDIKILTTVETKNTKKSIQKSMKLTDNISSNELGDLSPIRKRVRLNDKDNEIFNKLVSLNNMKKQVVKPIVIAKTADTKKKLVNVFSNNTNDFDHTNNSSEHLKLGDAKNFFQNKVKLDDTRNSIILEVNNKSNRVENEIKLDDANNRVEIEVNNTSNATRLINDEINKAAQMTDTYSNDEPVNLGDSTVTVLIADNDTTFPVNYSTSEPLKNLYTLLFGNNDGKLLYKNMLLSKYSNLKTIKYTGDIIKLQGKCVYKGIHVKVNYDFEKQMNLTYYEPTSMQTVIEEIESKLLIKVKQVRNNFGIITKSYIVKEDEVFDIFK